MRVAPRPIARFGALAAALALLAGCAGRDEAWYPDARLRPSAGRLEVELRSHVEQRGGHSDPLGLFLSEYDTSDWLYVPRTDGRVEAADLVFTNHWNCDRRKQKNLEGFVEFSGGSLVVALEVPRYDGASNTPSRHVPYAGNGTYRVRREPEGSYVMDREHLYVTCPGLDPRHATR